jgi:hypothetical protein
MRAPNESFAAVMDDDRPKCTKIDAGCRSARKKTQVDRLAEEYSGKELKNKAWGNGRYLWEPRRQTRRSLHTTADYNRLLRRGCVPQAVRGVRRNWGLVGIDLLSRVSHSGSLSKLKNICPWNGKVLQPSSLRHTSSFLRPPRCRSLQIILGMARKLRMPRLKEMLEEFLLPVWRGFSIFAARQFATPATSRNKKNARRD